MANLLGPVPLPRTISERKLVIASCVKHFGLGYGKEVCNGVVQFAILQRRLPEIVAYADVRNVASVKILDQSRLRFIAEIRLANGLTDRFYRWLAESASGPNAD
jgi:hypothetical protein